VDYTAVYPRQMIEGALRHNVIGMLFIHNHPDGPAEPARWSPPVRSVLPIWWRRPGSPRLVLTLPVGMVLSGRIIGFAGPGRRAGARASRWKEQKVAIGGSSWHGPVPAPSESRAPWGRVVWSRGVFETEAESIIIRLRVPSVTWR